MKLGRQYNMDTCMDTYKILKSMLKCDKNLYEKILDTPNFAHHFNELVKKALKHDKIISKREEWFKTNEPKKMPQV